MDSDLKLIREQNIKQLEAMMLEFDDEINESIAKLDNYTKPFNDIPKKKRKRLIDTTYLFKGGIPIAKRCSARLTNIPPEYSYNDLIDDDDIQSNRKRYYESDDEVENLEKVIFRKKKSFHRKTYDSTPFVPVEEITDDYLDNIAMRVVDKTYCSKTGTSCHQCRQKTMDSKTYCRSGHCVGVRGQFCGVCLRNRYGEDAKEALLDPNWECPPCRSLCNCSICRTREGKRPTGILAPLAFQYGHKSVKDFLISLNVKDGYINKPENEVNENYSKNKQNIHDHDEQFLIGFNQDHAALWIVRNNTISLHEEGSLVGFNSDKEPVMLKTLF